MFGEMPAYGFFIRHVRGLELSDVEVSFLKEDLRPAFVLNDVSGADFHRVKAQRAAGLPIFVLRDVADFNARQCTGLPDTQLARVKEKRL